MFLKLYLIALPVFFIIDMVWLGVVAKNFYQAQIGFLMRSPIQWYAAIIFYLLFLMGLVVFVIMPSLEARSLARVIMLGALFGLVTYATYDLTNLATVKDWPILVTLVDLVWGMVISVSVSVIVYYIAVKFIV